MSLPLVVREDLADAVRSKMVWGLVGAFVLVMAVLGVGLSAGGQADAERFMVFFASVGGELVIPVAALVVGYLAVTGDRQSGRLRVLHGLPHSRRDIVLGKALSRGVVVVLATLASFAAGGVVVAAVYAELALETFVGFALLTTLLGLSFAGVAVGVSASTATRGRAMAGAIGSYVMFTLLWEPAVAGVHYAVEGSLAGLDAPAWYLGLKGLSPIAAYSRVADSLFGQHVSGLVGWSRMVEDVPRTALQGDALAVSNRVAGEVPFYLTDAAAVAVLLAWAVVPVALGYRRFETADL
ncbi:ABC transporter permease [Halorussus halobius]|uniref:ABC transporter permease n=1 Tax=Halorussus halobius TaxID=1710537 RepID=UPI0010926377|nr:ABC transporter permease subunit [Halorussus halobius]